MRAMTATLSVVGQRVGRIEGAAKVSGGARYSGDIRLPGKLWGKVFRSTVAHARIVKLDVSKARALPGVAAVLTAEDLPPLMVGRRVKDQQVLARDRVRFIGDRIALVAAADPIVAEEALGLIEVEYEELQAVFDPFEALKPGSPLVHDDPRSYAGTSKDMPDYPNLQAYSAWSKGDIDQGFAESDLIFEQTFTTPRVHQVYIEPHTCTIAIDEEGQVQVWAANKTPYTARGWIATAGELELTNVTVNPVHIGGDFGGKGSHADLETGYFLAKHTGKPITMVMNYVDEMTSANPRHPSTIRLKTGLKRDGRLWAREASAMFDGGAYASFKPAGPGGLGGSSKGGGAYRIPHTKMEALIAYTNTVPCGHMRSPGSPQTLFAVESHMDYLAEQIGMDPLEFRRLNAIRDGDTTANGEHWNNVLMVETLDRARVFAGWDKPKPTPSGPGKLVGRGLSLGFYSTGVGESGTVIRVLPDGNVDVLTALPDTGTGATTILQQIVAEVLKRPIGQVAVKLQAPGDAPVDSGSGGSRVTNVAGTATKLAAEKTREALSNMASEYLGCPADEVELVPGWFEERSRPESRISWADLVERATQGQGGPVEITANYKPDHAPHEETFVVYVVDVEVDESTGAYKILNISAVNETGPLLNPINAEGQLNGGLMMGIGFAIMEELLMEDGRVTTVGLHDYKAPTMADAPPLKMEYITTGMGSGPFGAKGVGELSIVAIAPAIANAVHDATGVRVLGLPITAEKLFWAMQERKAAAPA
jgi:CO/xanthine dehydrogenase Mo-binding subunit